MQYALTPPLTPPRKRGGANVPPLCLRRGGEGVRFRVRAMNRELLYLPYTRRTPYVLAPLYPYIPTALREENFYDY